MAYATGLFPLLVVGSKARNTLYPTPPGVSQTKGFARFSGYSRRERPNKQVTKLGNADGLLIH